MKIHIDSLLWNNIDRVKAVYFCSTQYSQRIDNVKEWWNWPFSKLGAGFPVLSKSVHGFLQKVLEWVGIRIGIHNLLGQTGSFGLLGRTGSCGLLGRTVSCDLGRTGSCGLLDRTGSCGFLGTRELKAVALGNLEVASALGELKACVFWGDLEAEAVVS